jgi:predicted nuclease of restriction endonuclease-like (RecB) superfamily
MKEPHNDSLTNHSALMAEPELTRVEALYHRVQAYVQRAKEQIVRSIDHEMLRAYWLIGRDLVEDEQAGEARATYGKAVLQSIASKLRQEFGKGFSVDTLERSRKFYLFYSKEGQKKCSLEAGPKSATVLRKSEVPVFKPNLSWSHYLLLLKVDRREARTFYEIEASHNHWSTRELARQIGSLLFDRLAKSKDKEGLLKLAHRGQEINKPQDLIKDPWVLEFLDLPEAHQLTETRLEKALIDNLQDFLLELGKGFAFVSRQKRITLENNHFYTDLVFYHMLLKCYCIIDLKTRPVTHGDLGQMLFYVNYYDREIKEENDNPTIGLVLCTEKTDKMVQYTLGDSAKQIFASKYQFHLPTEEELENELKKEMTLIKDQLGNIEE